MVIKFLGTSSVKSIPRENCQCDQCQSSNPKDCRTRSALLINNQILVDCGPDIIKQLEREGIEQISDLFLTHLHDDHILGLKDLSQNQILKVYTTKEVFEETFEKLGLDKSNFNFHPLEKDKVYTIDKLKVSVFRVPHLPKYETLGLLIDSFLYIPDIDHLESIFDWLRKAKILILDGSMLKRKFGGHLAIIPSLKILQQFKNLKRIYFTHNGHTHLPHKELEKIIQEKGGYRCHLAYDGLVLTLSPH